MVAHAGSAGAIGEAVIARVRQLSAFTPLLHILYVINDVLFHSITPGLVRVLIPPPLPSVALFVGFHHAVVTMLLCGGVGVRLWVSVCAFSRTWKQGIRSCSKPTFLTSSAPLWLLPKLAALSVM